MPKTSSKPKSADPVQRERFEQVARELGVELDEEKLKETLRKVAPKARANHKENTKDD